MLDYATSELYRLLVAQGAAKPPAGTGGIGNEKAAGSYDSAAPQFARAGEDLRTSGGLKLVWSNTTLGHGPTRAATHAGPWPKAVEN